MIPDQLDMMVREGMIERIAEEYLMEGTGYRVMGQQICDWCNKQPCPEWVNALGLRLVEKHNGEAVRQGGLAAVAIIKQYITIPEIDPFIWHKTPGQDDLLATTP